MLDMTYVRIAQEQHQSNKQSNKSRNWFKEREGDIIFAILILIALVVLAAGIIIKTQIDGPYKQGYYKATETVQPDGSHYIYVTE